MSDVERETWDALNALVDKPTVDSIKKGEFEESVAWMVLVAQLRWLRYAEKLLDGYPSNKVKLSTKSKYIDEALALIRGIEE
jgi:hypothetical protein